MSVRSVRQTSDTNTRSPNARRARPLRSYSAARALFVAVTVLGVALGSGSSTAYAGSPVGQPTFQGALIVSNGQALAFVGVVTWGAVYAPVSNGSQVFATSLLIILYDLTGYNVTVRITTEGAGQTSAQGVTLTPAIASQVTLALPQSTSWTGVKVVIGGVPQYYQAATPLSLLPPSITNVGGLDILILAVLSEAMVGIASAASMARWLTKRAGGYAPKFSLLIWGHVLLIGIATSVILDYQWVDSTFAGWSPLVYAVPFSGIFFLFFLSLFNSATYGLALRGNAPLAGRLSFHAWRVQVGVSPKGDRILIDPTWWGFWARVWGHWVTLTSAQVELLGPEIFTADIKERQIVPRNDFFRHVRRPSPSKADPLDDFKLVGAYADGKPHRSDGPLPSQLYWVRTGMPVEVSWPRLTIHREIEVPAESSPEGAVIVPAHVERKLSLPHYTEGKADFNLDDIHRRSAISVVAQWRTAEDLAHQLSEVSLDLEGLKAHFENNVRETVKQRLLARYALMGWTANDLSAEEAALEAERTKDSSPSLESLFGAGPLSSLGPKASKPKED